MLVMFADWVWRLQPVGQAAVVGITTGAILDRPPEPGEPDAAIRCCERGA